LFAYNEVDAAIPMHDYHDQKNQVDDPEHERKSDPGFDLEAAF